MTKVLKTLEEIRETNRLRAARYYARHKDEINARSKAKRDKKLAKNNEVETCENL